MKNEIAGAYLNLLIGKDLDVHHTGDQSGNITVHARGWHSPSCFSKRVRQPPSRAWQGDGQSLQVDGAVAGGAVLPWTPPELGTWSPLPLHAHSLPRLRQHSRVKKGRLSHGNDITTKTDTGWSYFFPPMPFISRQCSGANWTWLGAKSELRLNQFRQR